MGQRIVHCASSSRGSNKGPPRSGRTHVRPPGCCSCSGQSDERRARGVEGPGQALRRPWAGPGRPKKRKKGRRRGSNLGPSGPEARVLTARPRRPERTKGRKGGWGAGVCPAGQKMVDFFRHIDIGVCFFARKTGHAGWSSKLQRDRARY